MKLVQQLWWILFIVSVGAAQRVVLIEAGNDLT